MKKYILGLMAIAGLSMTACNNDESADILAATEPQAVNFSAEVGKATTRHKGTTWTGNELVKIKANDAVKEYKVIDTSGTMELNNAAEKGFLWQDGNAEYKAIAWSSVIDGKKNIANQNSEDAFWACDMLKSEAIVKSAAVTFTFDHAMTHVWCLLDDCKGYTTEEIAAARITFYGHNEITFNEGVVAPQGNKDQVITPKMSKQSHNGKECWVAEAIMAPCEMWDQKFIRIEIAGKAFVYTPKKSDTDAETKEVGLLKPGYIQKYFLNIDKSKHDVEVNFSSNNINGFKDDGSDKGPVFPDAE